MKLLIQFKTIVSSRCAVCTPTRLWNCKYILRVTCEQLGLALSWAGQAPSLLTQAEPNLTSARSAHEKLGIASRAKSEPLQWLGSARLTTTPPWLACSWLTRTARWAYMCNIHFVRFGSKYIGWIVCYQVSTAKFAIFMNWLDLVIYNSSVWMTIDSICMLLSIRRQIQWSCT